MSPALSSKSWAGPSLRGASAPAPAKRGAPQFLFSDSPLSKKPPRAFRGRANGASCRRFLTPSPVPQLCMRARVCVCVCVCVCVHYTLSFSGRFLDVALISSWSKAGAGVARISGVGLSSLKPSPFLPWVPAEGHCEPSFQLCSQGVGRGTFSLVDSPDGDLGPSQSPWTRQAGLCEGAPLPRSPLPHSRLTAPRASGCWLRSHRARLFLFFLLGLGRWWQSLTLRDTGREEAKRRYF